MEDTSERAPSLYERIGGEAAVARLLDEFYDRVLADPELAPFFENTSMDRLRAMQREFFAAALDGPIRYSGLSLAEAHGERGIRPRHLKRFVDHLLETLRDEDVDEDAAFEIVSRIHTYASEITGEVGVDG